MAPVGTGHAVHEVVPHELGLVFATHSPLQLCVPVAHPPEQDCALSMQTPLHSVLPVGQAPPH